ncbi:hydrolase [Synergistales bacterium]|nr:hydrolase [Synergistales bacterium]
MIGAIIGDIVGSVYEFNNIKTKDFPLFGKKNFFTDDTVMTIAVAEGLMNGGKPDDFIDAMKRYGRLYPDAGYGGRFKKWLFGEDRKPNNSWGNGSAMRVSPVAWFFGNLAEVKKYAKISAAVTHNHPEGIKGAQAAAAAIFLARRGKSKAGIRAYIENKYGYDLSRTLDEIRPAYKFNESCRETVPEAIIAFLESTDFEDAIRNAISLGGDSDTLAAITGSVAEAAYGVPEEIRDKAMALLDAPLLKVLDRWEIDRDTPFDELSLP